MVTITLPAWLIWTLIAMFVVQTILNFFLARLTRANGEASRKLISKLTELALRR